MIIENEAFCSNGKITAVLMGSSNYLPTSYLKNVHSEADILLMNNLEAHNRNIKIIDFLKDMLCNQLLY